ncbi:hypothetical protein D9C73_027773 [Collichthys lucidus]|uniref:Uncharacterized protein n=1 Tax=Collichthys lucidus TaxID=240159 RepID=A0A4U5TW35_COLLU|nr:hypothetical protein D9C73_027773 [Collichthys lucidus]
MASLNGRPLSIWKRRDAFDHSLSLKDTLTEVIKNIFSKYENVLRRSAAEIATSTSLEGSSQATDASYNETLERHPVDCAQEHEIDRDVSMSSEYSFDDSLHNNPPKVIHFENSDSEESMSIARPDLDYEDDFPTYHRYHRDEDNSYVYQGGTKLNTGRDLDRENLPRRLGTGEGTEGGGVGGGQRGGRGERGRERARGDRPSTHCAERRCLRCEAYDAHCKSAAENYRRVLTSYTKTVSELMIGFKKVLERYPELRADSGDEHLHYMVQAALGRNNLVREMVRLATRRQAREATEKEHAEDEIDNKCDRAVVSVREALKTCYTDSQALGMILQRYVDLHVRYIEVWREMCTKVTKDITVMEFINLTQDRPGASYGDGEPWSEAKAYVARMLNKVHSITPRAVGEACARALKNIDFNLSSAPADFDKRKRVLEAQMEDIRAHLDRNSQKWSWDSCMNDLYFEIRSDLTVLEVLVGVGEISVKTLLYERFMLVSQVRRMTRNEGSLELQVAHARSKLRESVARYRHAEMNMLQW